MKYVPGNAQHIGSRNEQQDSFGFSNPDDLEFVAHGGFLAVLADGAGGMQQGAAASRVAVKVFLDSYREKVEPEAIQSALRRSLARANAAVRAVAKKANAQDNVATTLVAAVVHQEKLQWLSVGDSALYLYRDGLLSLLTDSHTYGQELDHQASLGHISREAALHHSDRDALTSYVGIQALREIDENPEPVDLHSGDKILLSSDGLFKTLTVAEIGADLALASQAACDSLIEKTLKKNRDHQDNVTVLCIAMEADKQEHGATGPLPIARHAASHNKIWSKFLDRLRLSR